MLRLKNLSNKFQKRLIRPLYAQTQAYPYATVLHESLRNTDGSFRAPLSTDTSPTYPLTRSANAFTYKSGLVPGTVMAKALDEKVFVHPGGASTAQPFGLLANFVGGDIDDLGDENMVGVWRGPDSVFELLAPSFDDTGLAAANVTAGAAPLLYAGPDGRLVYNGSPGSAKPVARLVERVSAQRIVIEVII